jgi:hypothetical protein
MEATLKKAYVPGQAPLELTFQQFLINPTGTGSSAVANRSMIIAGMEAKFSKLMKRVSNKMEVRSYLEKDGAYIIHALVPSESFDVLKYDVLVELRAPDEETAKTSTVNGWAIRFYSNSPAFTFTYAHVVDKMGLLLPMARSKCTPQSLTDEPKVRNPVLELGFEKSVYFALMYMREFGLTAKAALGTDKPNKVTILKSVKSSADKLKEYQLAEKASRAKKPVLATAGIKGGTPPKASKTGVKSTAQVKQVGKTGAAKSKNTRVR